MGEDELPSVKNTAPSGERSDALGAGASDGRPVREAHTGGRGRWRPGLWLTTLSTVVAVATGMFTLRNQIFPASGGRAQADPNAYAYSVAQVCSGMNQEQRLLLANDRRLAGRLRAARTPTAQASALISSWTDVLDQSQHQLSLFEGLDAPASAAARQRVTQRAWADQTGRIRGVVQNLNAAASERGLQSAVGRLPAVRTAISADEVIVDGGLTNLGSGHCNLRSPINFPVVTLGETASRSLVAHNVTTGEKPRDRDASHRVGRSATTTTNRSSPPPSDTAVRSTPATTIPAGATQPKTSPPPASRTLVLAGPAVSPNVTPLGLSGHDRR